MKYLRSSISFFKEPENKAYISSVIWTWIGWIFIFAVIFGMGDTIPCSADPMCF